MATSNRRPSDFQCLRPYRSNSQEALVLNGFRHMKTHRGTSKWTRKGQKKGQKLLVCLSRCSLNAKRRRKSCLALRLAFPRQDVIQLAT